MLVEFVEGKVGGGGVLRKVAGQLWLVYEKLAKIISILSHAKLSILHLSLFVSFFIHNVLNKCDNNSPQTRLIFSILN